MTDQDILTIPPAGKGAALGFGAMRLPSGADTCRAMFDSYLEAGFNYFDTAYVYGNSEAMLQKALAAHHPRDSYLLADKMPPWMARSQSDCDKLLRESLSRCGTDYFDFYLIHSLDDGNYRNAQKAGAFEWAAAQKQKGTLRHVGFSFHGSASLLERILSEHPEMEFVQLQINYADVLRGQAGELQQIAIRHNKPIIVMEPVKGGLLAKLPIAAEAIFKAYDDKRSLASWAMRYAASLAGVTCVLSGMSTPEQVRDNVDTFSPLITLKDEEYGVIESALAELSKIASIPCTACKYCVADCPQQIEIPVCFSLYNDDKRGGAHWNLEALYAGIEKGRTAADCISCGACVERCPQHINIPDELAKVASVFK